MLRVALLLILGIHGLIHVLGFIKALEWIEITQLAQSISKVRGVLWLFCSLGFIIAAVVYFQEKEWWWIIGMFTLILSQFLISSNWQDAKFGTIPNTIILMAVVLGYGGWNFERKINLELRSFLSEHNEEHRITDFRSMSELPPIVKKWLNRSNIFGHERIQLAHLHQVGTMRTTQESKWMPVKAEQWFSIDQPGFFWKAHVGRGFGIHFSGRDAYSQGNGQMLIELFSLFPVVNESGPFINQGALARYLAEIIWFPWAALSDHITWEVINDTSSKATIKDAEMEVTGTFNFTSDGDVVGFEAQRFYTRKDGAKMEDWSITVNEDSYRVLDGIRIPTEATVTWKLSEGDFTWYRIAVTEAVYNGR